MKIQRNTRISLTVDPTSTPMICPVIYAATGKQRKVTIGETSLASPTQPIGVPSIKRIPTSISSAVWEKQNDMLKLCRLKESGSFIKLSALGNILRRTR